MHTIIPQQICFIASQIIYIYSNKFIHYKNIYNATFINNRIY